MAKRKVEMGYLRARRVSHMGVLLVMRFGEA